MVLLGPVWGQFGPIPPRLGRLQVQPAPFLALLPHSRCRGTCFPRRFRGPPSGLPPHQSLVSRWRLATFLIASSVAVGTGRDRDRAKEGQHTARRWVCNGQCPANGPPARRLSGSLPQKGPWDLPECWGASGRQAGSVVSADCWVELLACCCLPDAQAHPADRRINQLEYYVRGT